MIEELIKNNEMLVKGNLKIKPGQDINFSPALTSDDIAAQGDLYFRRISESEIPDNYMAMTPFKQMVPGNTKGAKHTFNEMPLKCFVPQGWSAEESYKGSRGPIVVIGPNVLTHAEHGNWTLELEKDCIEFGYQNDWDYQEKEIVRQRD